MRTNIRFFQLSLGTDLLERVASVCSLESSGIVLFKVALDQVMFMNASTIRTLSNRLGGLALNKVPGEDVSTLTLEVSEIARELEGSGNAPTDLINLVSKPYTKVNNEMFKTHALGLHSQIMKGDCNDNWTNLVTTHNAFHQDLAQSGHYEEGGGSADPDAKIQALIAQTVEKKFGRLQATGDHQQDKIRERMRGAWGSSEGLPCRQVERI